MASRTHGYVTNLTWTGNRGVGTASYESYDRAFQLEAGAKPTLFGSADVAFHGDAGAWNPEDLLVASLSGCHQLWYLHLCSRAGIVVTAYRDRAEGIMTEEGRKGGAFTSVVLRPEVRITDGVRIEEALALHEAAHEVCFIARSVNFPVTIEPKVEAAPDEATDDPS